MNSSKSKNIMVAPTLSLTLLESWRNTHDQSSWIWVADMTAKTWRSHHGLPKTRDNKYALELPFARHDILHPSKEPKNLLTSQRKKDRHSWPWNVDSLECR
jgi:hypothetical protein